jgi:hypothetical protein
VELAFFKVKSTDNVADIVIKPVVGALFLKHRATVLGIDPEYATTTIYSFK